MSTHPETPRRPVLAAVLTTTLALAIAVVAMVGALGSSRHDSGQTEGPAPDELRVGLTEWSIVLPVHQVAPGRVALVVTNAGATGHDLVVEGVHGGWRTPVLEAGEQADLLIRTAPGETLHLDCSVPGHHSAGMHLELLVAEDP
jgi:hypothetical protein